MPKKAKVYFWFQGATVIELARRLQAIGPDKARLEVHPYGVKDCLLEVFDATLPTEQRLVALDEAHPCPPEC